MKPKFPRLTSYGRRVLSTIAIVFVIGATVFAQLGTFNPAFEGELWGVRYEITPANDGVPAGIAFSGGTMFVADSENQTILAYNPTTGAPVTINNADWNFDDLLSPAFGLVPHQLTAVTVRVGTTDRDALLVTDAMSNRIAAFRTNGDYLFTLRLQRPVLLPPLWQAIGQVAMSPGSRFNLNGTTVTLTGSFAAGWTEQSLLGEISSGALVYQQATASFATVGLEVLATYSAVLNGQENSPAAPAPLYFHGVTYDTAGNLYALDAFTERLHVYSPALTRLFTFGTPTPDGTLAEFVEPWGLAFWPDAGGGRLFINDTYNSRIRVFRPVDGNDVDTVIDNLQFEYDIANFVAPVPPIELFSIAIDTATGTLAVSDFAQPRVVVLQKPRLAAFNIEVLNASDQLIDSVCTAATYKIRFSLTVPAGMPNVTNVAPQLSITPSTAIGAPTGAPNPTTLTAGQTATYTYTLTAPTTTAGGDISVLASATAGGGVTDILSRAEIVSLSNCAGESDPSTITATPSEPPQVSGWTPVYEGDAFTVTLAAQDDDGIDAIQYELTGAIDTGDEPIETNFNGIVTNAIVVVPFDNFGRTTLRYRVRDGNAIWSGWQTLDIRTKQVVNRSNNENTAIEFRVGDPEGVGFTYSVTGLPAGAQFSPTTGQFTGVISFDAKQPYSTNSVLSSGVYNVVVTETASNNATSSVSFTWTINHINRPPVITNQPVTGASIQQGELFELKINGSDPDGDPVIFTMNGSSTTSGDLPESVTIDPSTGQISGVFPMDSDDHYSILVGLAECAEQTANAPCNQPVLPQAHLATFFNFELEVLDANLPPDITNPGPQTSAEGDTVSLQIQVSDAEGDDLTFEAAGLPDGLSIHPDTGLITGTVGYDEAGQHSVTVEVDDHVNTPPRTVTFFWNVTNTNRPPVIEIPERVNVEGETLPNGASIAPYVTDPEGTPVTLSATGLPPGVTMNASGGLSGSFDFASDGVYTVIVTASDGSLTSEGSFTWTVFNVNRRPTLEPVNQVNYEGDTVSYQVVAGDPDGDALEFSSNGLPNGLTLNASTGLISGTLNAPVGTYTVNIAVADLVPNSLSELKSFTWTVRPPNRPPDVVNPGNQTSNEGATISLQIASSDPDGDTLTWFASGLPTGLSIDGNGKITGTLSHATSGTYTVTVRGTDPSGLFDEETFTWTVNNVNLPPTALPDTASVIEGQSVVISVLTNDSDADGGTLTVINVTQPSVGTGTAVISGGGTTVTYSAPIGFSGPVATFTYTVSDGQGGSVTANVTVAVTPLNVPPVCTAVSVSPGVLWPPNHKPRYITISGVVDPDGGTPTMSYSILQDEPTNTQGDGNTNQDAGVDANGVWVRAERMGGENANVYGRVYIIGYTATDAQGASCSGTVFVGVPHDQGNHNQPIPSAGRWNSVTGALVVAPPPNAVNDSATTKKNTAKVIAVKANDVVYGSVALSIVSAPAPGTGTVTVNLDGTVTYTPATNWTGTASFTYQLSNAAGSDTAVVTVTVKK